MNKINWLRLDSRLQELLTKAPNLSPDALGALLVRIDFVIASETRRGNIFTENQAQRLANLPIEWILRIEEEEWKIVE